MNKKLKIALITLAVTVVLVVAAVLIATLIKPSPEAEPYALPSAGSSDNIVTETPSDEPEPSASPEHVNTVTSTLAVGGDIVMHTGLNGEAMTDSGYDYVPIFGILKDFIAKRGLLRLLTGDHARHRQLYSLSAVQVPGRPRFLYSERRLQPRKHGDQSLC